MSHSPVEKLTFNRSESPTIGVEIELPIIDRDSKELAPGSPRILAACKEEGIEGVSAELMQSMIELQTGVCENVRDAHQQLLPKLRRVRNLANSTGYDLALLASHPSAKPNEHVLFNDEHYHRAHGRLAWLIYHRVTFGLHVHFGVRSGDEAIGLINLLVQHLPHLIGASGNSPFWQGVDTGLTSARCALYNLITHAGVPQYFSNWGDFRDYIKTMQEAKALKSVTSIKWDIRPRPDLGTIEIRVCDTPKSLRHLFGLVALIRTLCIAGQRLLEERPRAGRGDIRRQWIAGENRWLASRHGLEAIYISTPRGKRTQLRNDLAELVERLSPIAAETGDLNYLNYLKPVDKLECGAELQRKLYRDSGKWQSIVEHGIVQLNRDIEELAPRPETATG